MFKSLRYSLLATFAILLGMQTQAKTVTFDFITNGLTMFDGITAVSSNDSQAGDFTEEKSYTLDGVTITVSPSGGRNANRFWSWDNGSQLRVYGGTIKFTSSSEKMTAMQFTQPTKSQKWTAPTASVGTMNTDAWTCAEGTNEVTFTFSAQCRMNAVTVTLGDGGDTPDPQDPGDTKTEIFSESFASSLGEFSILERVNPDNLANVWAWNNSKYAKANAYSKAKAHDYVGYLISPTINLTSAKSAEVSFDHAGQYFHTPETEATLWVITENGDTTQVPINSYFTNKNWTSVTNTTDLTSFVGKNVKIAFKYTASAANGKDAGTWEIKNFKVIANVGGAPTPQPADNETIESINKMTADKANINLKLNNAKVVYVNGKNIHVREGGNAVLFFNTNLPLTLNATVSGEVNVDYDNYYGVHELKDNSNTKADGLTITAGTSTDLDAVEATPADLKANKHIADLVVLKNVQIAKVISGNYTDYYAFVGTDSVQLYSKTNADLYTAKADDGKTYDVYALFNNIFHNAPEIEPVLITESGTTPTPQPSIVEAANIAEFIALPENKDAELTLANAQVLYTWTSSNNNNKTYIKDATGTLLLYNAGLDLAANQIVNGKVILQRAANNNMVEAKPVTGKTTKDGLTITTGTEAVPTEITPAQGAANVSNLVVLKNVKIVAKASSKRTNYYAVAGSDSLQVYDGFHIDGLTLAEAENATITGIVEQYRSTYEVYPIKPIETTATGINSINADGKFADNKVYNLAGQRVSKNYRGVVIINGKKYINK